MGDIQKLRIEWNEIFSNKALGRQSEPGTENERSPDVPDLGIFGRSEIILNIPESNDLDALISRLKASSVQDRIAFVAKVNMIYSAFYPGHNSIYYDSQKKESCNIS